MSTAAGPLHGLVVAIFRHAGSAPDEAAAIADHLIEANLVGHDSHGVIRVAPYLKLVAEGGIFANRRARIMKDAGALITVDNQIDPATGTVKLRAQFANGDNALFPNQFVNVRMKLDTQRDAVVIPSAAIQRGAQGFFVYVVKSDQTVSVRPVKPGTVDGQRTAIADGLVAGEIVVMDGMDRLRDGARVEVTQRPEFKPSEDGQGRAGKGMRRKPPAGEEKAAPGASVK